MFPSFQTIHTHLEVWSFACRLMDKPQDILQLLSDRITKYYDRNVKHFIEGQRTYLKEPLELICSQQKRSKGALDYLWNKILARRKEMESISGTVSSLHNRFVCVSRRHNRFRSKQSLFAADRRELKPIPSSLRFPRSRLFE